MAISKRKAKIEKARRLARGSLLAFLRWCWWMPHELVVGRHTRAICDRLTRASDEWREGKSTFLLIAVPFRHGKSDIVSRAFPAWFLGRNADRQPDVIMSGYGISLVRGFSKRVKRIMEEPRYQMLFPGVHPARGSNKAEEWQVEGSAGTVVAQGFGGAVTGKGAHCVTGETPVITPRGMFRVDELFRLGYRGLVLSYNHVLHRAEWRRVTAAQENTREDILEITAENGNRVRCTSDHRVYADGRYQEARCLGERQACATVALEQDVRGMRRGQGARRPALQGLLHACKEVVFACRRDVRLLRQDVHPDTRGREESGQGRLQRRLLFGGLFAGASRGQKQAQVREVRRSRGEEDPQILRGLQGNAVACAASAGGVRVLRHTVPPKIFNQHVLLDGLQKQAPQPLDAGQQQSALHRRDARLPDRLRAHVVAGLRAGRGAVRRLFGVGDPAGSPHQPRQRRQSAREPDPAVPVVPYDVPQVRQSDIRSVEAVGAGPVRVYDLQVEGNSNFFAGGILVHNCLIIDDYCKNRAEAVSSIFRNKTWDAFRNDLMTRLNAPTSIVIVCATPWHVDDLRGRIRKAMEEDPSFPRFEELRFPASQPGEWEYLFPERFGVEWYEAQRASLGRQAAALLDCDPVIEGGNRFDVSRVVVHHDLDNWPVGRDTRGWDLASSSAERGGDDPDWTVGVRGCVRRISLGQGAFKHEVWIREIVACRAEAPKRDALIRATALADGGAVNQHVEAFGGYKDAYTSLKAAMAGVCVVKPSRLPGDKSAKLAALEPSFENGDVHVYAPGCGKWLDLWREQFASFPDGKKDDFCDATAVMFHSHAKGGSTMLI